MAKGRELELAIEDFEKTLELESDNREAKQKLAIARKKLVDSGKRQDKLFASMFKASPAAAKDDAAVSAPAAPADNSDPAPAGKEETTESTGKSQDEATDAAAKSAAAAKAAESDDEFFDAPEA